MRKLHIYTIEERKKITQKMKELWQNSEYRNKMVNAHKGKRCSKETREKMRIGAQLGEKNHRWKGGRMKIQGYILKYQPNHPYATFKGKYVREHRLIMEKYLRKTNPNHPALIEINGEKYLNIKWIVHHKNGRRDDNRIENLELYYKNKHPIGQNICPKCGYKF